jgi:hypothetical protein
MTNEYIEYQFDGLDSVGVNTFRTRPSITIAATIDVEREGQEGYVSLRAFIKGEKFRGVGCGFSFSKLEGIPRLKIEEFAKDYSSKAFQELTRRNNT